MDWMPPSPAASAVSEQPDVSSPLPLPPPPPPSSTQPDGQEGRVPDVTSLASPTSDVEL
jgi:hypothetical protein